LPKTPMKSNKRCAVFVELPGRFLAGDSGAGDGNDKQAAGLLYEAQGGSCEARQARENGSE
jgi:hypothetical protein